MNKTDEKNLLSHLEKLGLNQDEAAKALAISISILNNRDPNIELEKPTLEDLIGYKKDFDINVIKEMLNKAI